MKLTLSAVAVAALAGSAFGQATVFNNQAAFVNQLAGPFLQDNFDGVPTGLVDPLTGLDFSQNGFSFNVNAVDSAVDGDGTNDGLFNDPGLLSNNSATDAMVFTFTSGNVTAVGGNFFSSDISFAPIPLMLDFQLSDGTNVQVTTSGASDFTGFVNLNGITSLTVDALDDPITPAFNWPAADAIWVGRAVPTPGAISVLGLAGLAAARRRR
jgi:hypothetical protein